MSVLSFPCYNRLYSLFAALVPASLPSAPTSFASALLNGPLYLLCFLVVFPASDCASSLARNRVNASSRNLTALFSCFLVALAAEALSPELGSYRDVQRVPLSVQGLFSSCALCGPGVIPRHDEVFVGRCGGVVTSERVLRASRGIAVAHAA